MAAYSQPFATQWMSPSTWLSPTTAVWFKRTFLHSSRPRRAFITMAATSKTVLYVNGRNVSTALYMSPHTNSDTSSVAISYDITHLMRPDTNTVSVLTCPTTNSKKPQLSICYYGTDLNNTHYAHSSTDGWLCSPSATSMPDSGNQQEHMDGRLYVSPTLISDIPPMGWLPVATSSDSPVIIHEESSSLHIGGTSADSHNTLYDNALHPHRVLRPRYFNRSADVIAYDFSPGFYGLIRVTLRGCRRGEHINISGLTYICNGTTDEQALTLFTPIYARRIIISGDSHFSPDQVQDVEAICF